MPTEQPSNVRLSAEGQLAAIGQAVITTDLAGIVQYWNPAAETLYGWTAEEALGRNVAELTVSDEDAAMASNIMLALRDGRSWSGGFRVRRKDGSTFQALVTDAPIYDNGRIVGIVAISTSVGAALRPLLERSTDAALVLRSDGVISYASPAVTQLFGWKGDEIVGSSAIPLLHPEDREALAAFLEQAVKQPGAHTPLELRVRRDNQWTWAEAALTNLLDDPLVRGVVCNLRLAARRTAQEAAEVRADQLQTALTTRLVIEQAKGFLAGRDGVPPEAAFERLRKYARDNHLPIHEVSRRVLARKLSLAP